MDVGDLFRSLGIHTVSGTTVNKNNTVSNAGAPVAKKPSGFSLGNLGHSVVGAGEAITGGLYHAATDGITGLVGGAARNLHLGAVQNVAKNNNKIIADKQLQLERDHKNGKITSDEYKKGYQALLTASNKSVKDNAAVTKATNAGYYGHVQAAKDTVSAGVTAATIAAPFLAPLKAAGGVGVVAKVAKGIDASVGAGKGNVATKVVRNALVSQPDVKMVGDTAQGKNVVENTALTAASLALPAAGRVAGKAVKAVKDLTHDTSGLYDHIKLANGKTVNENIAEARANGTLSKTTENHLKVANDQNMAQHGTVYSAAKAVNEHLDQGDRRAKFDLKGFAAEQGRLARAHNATHTLNDGEQLFKKDGTPVPQSATPNLTVGKASQSDKSQIAGRLANAFDAEKGGAVGALNERDALKEEFPVFFNNNQNSDVVTKILSEAQSGKEIKARINSALTGTSELFTKNDAGDLVVARHPGGYHSIEAQNPIAPFRKPGEVAPIDTGNKAKFGGVGDTLRKSGVGLEPTNREELNDTLVSNFNKHIDAIPALQGKGDAIYKALGSALQAGPTGANTRSLLTKNEISKALDSIGVSSKDFTSSVRTALDKAQGEIPLSQRGLGGKVTDALTSKIPGERQLLRVQQVGRFSGLNPFFQTKTGVKSGALAQAFSGGHLPFGKVPQDVSDYISKSGLGKMFASQFDDFIGTLPNANRGFMGKVLQNVSGLMMKKMLQNHGVSVADLANNPALKTEIDHAIESVFGYPKGGFLDSNFAKAMNVVLFPFRFEAKVLGAMGHFLLKADPVTRIAAVTGIVHANDWIKSPQGVQWQRHNSELANITKYFTPVGTIGQVIDVLSGKGSAKPADLGLLGGLPLGFITTILEGQGVKLSSPGTDTKTGEQYTQKIPADTATRFKQGLVDFVDSLYSFPGKQLGLGPKAGIPKALAPALGTGKYTTPSIPAKPSTATPSALSSPDQVVGKLGATKFGNTPSVNPALASQLAKQTKPKKAKVHAVRPGTPF